MKILIAGRSVKDIDRDDGGSGSSNRNFHEKGT